MEKRNKQILGIGILLFGIIVLISYPYLKQEEEILTEYVIDESDFIKGNSLIENIDQSPVDNEEITGLILMREEEKLAKDVYLTLYDKWNLKIFNNIANSEQTHTDAVKILLERYNITDPVKENTIGSFTSEELSNLYNDLIEIGSKSLLDALIVGATVEDLDIKDLNELLTKTDNGDIIATYNNLNKGSRNHMRAFIKQIESNGGSYVPQYISEEEFNSIISSNQERGSV